MPELQGVAKKEKAKREDHPVRNLVIMVLILLGLLLVYWLLTRPLTIKGQPTSRGITNIFSIYGVSRNDLFKEPNAVYVHTDGDIYVADTGNHRIAIFNSSGQYKNKITLKKNKKESAIFDRGDLITPLGVGVDSRGRIYTTSFDSGIIVFSPQGRKIRQLPIPSIQVIIEKKKVYVTGVGSIYGFNSKFEIVDHIGSKGRNLGQFESPNDLTIDGKGNMVVSDSQNMRLQIFDKKGELAAYKGEPPKNMNDNKGRLVGLGTGITQDDQGRIFVADALHNAIRIFDKEGNDLGEIGQKGRSDGLFDTPTDIFFMGGNTFAIADKWNDRIQIVQINAADAREAGTPAVSAASAIPRWAIVIGIIILLAIILLATRRARVASRRYRDLSDIPELG